MPQTSRSKKASSKHVSARPKSQKALAKKALAAPKRTTKEPVRRPIKPKKLPSVIKLSRSSGELIWRYKELFFGICLIYGLLNLVLVQGLTSGTSVNDLKTEIKKSFSGHLGSLGVSIGVYAELLGSAGNGSTNTAGSYQIILFVVASLALIFALRQVSAGTMLRIRDAFYHGMTPLVPFTLVLVFFFIQLIPIIVGSTLYGIVIGNGIALNILEKGLFLVLFLALAAWSLYLITSTLFALYIVTLPDMTPLRALRTAKSLVKHRRLLLLRKIFGLPVVLLLISAVIMIPIILVATVIAKWVFFILTTLMLLAVHTYLYNLYRELIND